jgi:hypothetical protein
MICPNCKFDYKDHKKEFFQNVRKTYDSFGLAAIQRVRECPNCGFYSLTEEKHTGMPGFPAVEVKQTPDLKTMISRNVDNWFNRFPNEVRLIKKIKAVLK